MADLLTLSELKSYLGVTGTADDAQYTALIPVASLAVQNYAQRDFGTAPATAVRQYQYDGSGYVEIDDCSVITNVAFVVPNGSNIVLPTYQWTALPFQGPIFTYIQLFADYSGVNPAMGFRNNLDVLYAEGRMNTATSVVEVTATFGWPSVPQDVKLATAWTIQDWKDKPSSDAMTSESIEGWSRSWAGRAASSAIIALGIPSKARDLLANYFRFDV